MRIGNRFGCVAVDVHANELRLAATGSVPIDPIGIHPLGAWVLDELFEGGGHGSESSAVDRRIDAVVPLDPGLQGHAREVRAADVGGMANRRVASGWVFGVVEEVGFGVEGHSGAALDDVKFQAWA